MQTDHINTIFDGYTALIREDSIPIEDLGEPHEAMRATVRMAVDQILLESGK